MSLELNSEETGLPPQWACARRAPDEASGPRVAFAAARHLLRRQWLYWYLGFAAVFMVFAGMGIGKPGGPATPLSTADGAILMSFTSTLVLATLLGIAAAGWSETTGTAASDGRRFVRRALEGSAGFAATGLLLVLLLDLGALALSPHLRHGTPSYFLQHVAISFSILLLQFGVAFCFGALVPWILAIPASLVLVVAAYFEPGRWIAEWLPHFLNLDRTVGGVVTLVTPKSGMLFGGALGTALRYHLPCAEVLRCLYYQAAYGIVYLLCGLCLHRLLRSRSRKGGL